MSLIRCLSEETLALKEIMERMGLKGRDCHYGLIEYTAFVQQYKYQ